MDDERLYHQWTRVLRYEIGREVVLFNDNREVRLYKIAKIGDNAVHVELVTELEPKLPEQELYLCFALLKKDKNEWVLQKGTELGVSHFVPLITDRTEKTGWDSERAEKIVIEATEQCERADIPRLRDPLHVAKLIEELSGKVDLYIAEEGASAISSQLSTLQNTVGVLVGPEGGWSDEEKQLFKEKGIKHLALSGFTLRAETAAITAAALFGVGYYPHSEKR